MPHKINSETHFFSIYSIFIILVGLGLLGFYSYQNYSIGSIDFKEALRIKIQTQKYNPISFIESDDEQAFERAIYSIESMGKEGADLIIRELNDKNISKKKFLNSIYILGRLGKNAYHSAPLIRQHLSNKDPDVRATSAKALGKIRDKSAVSDIAVLLFDENKWVRESAIASLKRIDTKEARKYLNKIKD